MPRRTASHLMAGRAAALRTMVAGALVASVSGAAMAESIGRVCLAPSNTAGQVVLIASTGCQSAGRGFRYEDVAIRLDGADVHLTGGFHYAKRGARQRDCMGTKSRKFVLPEPEGGSYRLLRKGKELAVLKAGPDRVCEHTRARRARSRHRPVNPFLSGNHVIRIGQRITDRVPVPVDRGDWGRRSADTLFGLFDAQLSGFPEMLEGRPQLEMTATKEDGERMRIEITETGVLDDSISGIRTIGRAKRDDAGWTLIDLHRQFLCGRGDKQGTWQAKCS
ncbi:MAG: hypothetical protein AAFV45_16170 [Pseudomonadota bacterium]